MSTRAMYTFKDENETLHVYKHSDGYPTGAADAILGALAFAWPLPRFEADDFAAAFVCANKLHHWMRDSIVTAMKTLAATPKTQNGNFDNTILNVELSVPYYAFGPCPVAQGGGVRLMQSGSVETLAPGDIQYRYEVTQSTGGGLIVAAFAVNNWESYSEKRIIKCKLAKFAALAKAYEDKQQAK